jgi:hypothetical protein
MEQHDDTAHPSLDPERYDELLDFVALVAAPLQLSGWSLGIREGERIRTHNRHFVGEVSAAFATIGVDEDLPGPVTLRTGQDQFFPDRSQAHRLYPAARAIDDDSVHQAAATLALRSARDAEPVGYLALHFLDDHTFDEHERTGLRRVAATVDGWLEHSDRWRAPGHPPR